jgi:gliding motility-associated-like protein
MNRILINTFLIILLNGTLLLGQDIQKPKGPTIHAVEVDPGTGDIQLVWEPSPSSDVAYYQIAHTNEFGNFSFEDQADKIYGYDSTYSFNLGQNLSKCYFMVAFDSANNTSDDRSCHTTISTSLKYDSCNAMIELTWNAYKGWNNGVKTYEVYDYYTDSLLETTQETYFKHKNVIPNTNYAYYVKAISYTGYTSTSYRAEKYTQMPEAPDYINISATARGNNTKLSYYADPDGEIDHFRLLRSPSFNSGYKSIKEFKNVPGGINHYTDDIDNTSNIYYYKIAALNSCGNEVKYSLPANNIILSTSNNKFINSLSWNNYKPQKKQHSYKIIRKTNINTRTIINGLNKTNYKDNVDSLKYNELNDKFCYYITAQDTINGQILTARSNTSCTAVEPDIYVPNGFTPNGDGKNDKFFPYFEFTPKKYKLAVYNKYGIILFETTNPSEKWDGTVSGKAIQQGVYAYSIYMETSFGKKVIKKGAVTVFYP